MRPHRVENAPEYAGVSEALFSIGSVAKATGISVDALRAWERRYGRPAATRLPSGHRRYSRAQVNTLRRIAEAVARGHRPSELLPLSDGELDAILASDDVGTDWRTRALIDLVREFRRNELTEALMDEWQTLDPLTFLGERVAPLLEAVGRHWALGELEIRHEHFLTEVLEDILRSLRVRLPDASPAWGVVVATLPGELHGLGVQMVALLCAVEGVTTHILGAGTPISEVVRLQRETTAQAVLISVSLATGGVETDRQLAELREHLPPDVQLLVGGSGARSTRRIPRGVTRLEDLGALASWLRQFRRRDAG